MMNRAIIVNGDFIVSEKHESIYEGDIVVDCNAIMKTFMTSRMSITVEDSADLDDVLDRAQKIMKGYEKDCTIVR